jgi:hypothetical protein
LGDTGFHGGRGWGIYSSSVNGRSGLGHNQRRIRAIGGAEELGNLFLGYVRLKTGSLYATIFLHGLMNLVATLEVVVVLRHSNSAG